MYKLKQWDYLIFIPIIGIYKVTELISEDKLSTFTIIMLGLLHGIYIQKLILLL